MLEIFTNVAPHSIATKMFEGHPPDCKISIKPSPKSHFLSSSKNILLSFHQNLITVQLLKAPSQTILYQHAL